MTDQIYDWKRFWCPRTGRINLTDGGYLYNPDSEWGSIYNPDVVSFESITEIPCLGLLGEPGMGKTKTLQTEQKAIKIGIKERGDEILWLDLRACGSEYGLVRDLFESQTFLSWTKGKNRLHLFLDSLDECLLRIDNVTALLIKEFKKYSIERLFLRIACRTADWRNEFEDELKQLWGDVRMGVYELSPLRRIDVIEAAKANGLDPSVFLDEIDQMNAVPLAIKPVTLGFLLNNYHKKGQFPPTQAELYLEGCRLLCEELNEGHRNAKFRNPFTAIQRMVVASRIAAVTIFANRYAVWTGVDQGNVPEEDITIQRLCGGSESVNGDKFEVSEAAIKEALATGLFSARGLNRMGWAHQTYAEFLAAWYLKHHQMALSQVMSLVVHPSDPDGRLVPQLHETSAWLAGMLPEVFKEIIKVDPQVLLRSDVATADVNDREKLVDNLLRLYDEEKLLDIDRDLRKHYRKLAHPGLAEQLRPYICDSTKGIVVRRVAIDIAEACELQEIQEDLTNIALDLSQPHHIREQAAYAISRIGDDNTRVKLKPLALGEAGDDPADQLKGYALKALWPAHIKSEELFAVLTPPKQSNFHGAYKRFLSQELVLYIQPGDLPKALRWIDKQPASLRRSFKGLVNALMLKAWENLKSPGVLEAFTKVTLSRLRRIEEIVESYFDETFKSAVRNDGEKRRLVVEAILPMLSDPEKSAVYLAYLPTPLIMSTDVLWMIERLLHTESEKIQKAWAQLIRNVFDSRDLGQFEALFVASQNNSVLAEAFEWLLKPIELNSPEALKMREYHLEMQERQGQKKDIPTLESPPSERIAVLLDRCESGDLAVWWQLNMVMTLEPDNTPYTGELESNLTILPGWKTADSVTRARILSAAKRYIMEQDPETHEWLGTSIPHRPALAGYRALRLLLQKAPDSISPIPNDVWKRWAPIILTYPILSDNGDEEPHNKLVETAYQHAPDEIIETLLIMIDKENEAHDRIFVTRNMKYCWDERLVNILLIKVKDKKLKPECMGCLLSDLIDHEAEEARTFAESFLTLPLPSSGDIRAKAIVAAHVLMIHTEDAGWSVVWPVIQQESEFGQEVISRLANSYDKYTAKFGERLTEDQLADLYIWLARQYPHAEDPKHTGAHYLGYRDNITDLRNHNILRLLKQRGTHQACEAIRRIKDELPELDWLKWTLLEAQNITRHLTWIPPRPTDILKIASNQEGRLVQSGDQLLDVIIESVKRLEAKLQGETPAAIDLWNVWNERKRKVYRPKDENRFSDYVKRHLNEDLKQKGVIVNREVEIRRGEGSTPGERTDIHVDAVIRDPRGAVYDSVSAIIEVKGCWNKDLDHAMETQLVNRYLKDNHCQHGVYLVGWFNCGQWDNGDYRKKEAPHVDINEAQKQFDSQATELSKQALRIKAFIMNTALR